MRPAVAIPFAAACLLLARVSVAEPSTVETIALPGGPPVGMDYLALDAAHRRRWVPAGNTGKIDVIDLATRKVSAIDGFATIDSPRPGRPRMGPSSATVAGDTVWVGNRGDNQICGFDAVTLAKKSCIKLAAMPDGVQYVATTRELWVTTPREGTLTIAATGGGAPASIKLPGEPEGYALDADRFYTNLEDKDRTLTIDVKTRKIIADWPAGCGSEGPRGLAVDGKRRLLFVACTDGVVTHDLAKNGAIVQRATTGKGVDNIDYLPARALLFVASREDGKLTTFKVEEGGKLAPARAVATRPGARNAVVDPDGNAYVADSTGGTIVLVPAAR
jgi:DNA-binding beta-propeller fold protein YncE